MKLFCKLLIFTIISNGILLTKKNNFKTGIFICYYSAIFQKLLKTKLGFIFIDDKKLNSMRSGFHQF